MKTKAAIRSAARLRLIESDGFDFEFLSRLAERESWRKDIHRPIYHIHKWWAKRLGSIFRGIILGCELTEYDQLAHSFYTPAPLPTEKVVFDPFMGSGTTIGEAAKPGCTALGRDINPVACEAVRIALGEIDRADLLRAFTHLSSTVGERIRALYRSPGEDAEVLYYFWVKQAGCPSCHKSVDLLTSRIFARHAYPQRQPEVRACCPSCGDITRTRHDDRQAVCEHCHHQFDPHPGNAAGAHAECPHCAHRFSIARALKLKDGPPRHRLFAKLLLTANGDKLYAKASPADADAYAECSMRLTEELAAGRIRLPTTQLAPDHNTKQAINYNYRAWRDFFNDRQLLALGWLQAAIAEWPVESTRDALLTLFSGVLEFNNLFASYKGEGTGAVRHMFSHHVLKPERTPLEANVWGTPRSSGSFSNLFKARLLRALDYRANPVEVTLDDQPVSAAPLACRVSMQWPAPASGPVLGIHLSCGSSHSTRLLAESVDLVVTDPPFFDNVHYSELADFFHAWQTLYPRGFIQPATTTRQAHEVQDTEPGAFAAKLRDVFAECHRVLKHDRLLVFTYHHSRNEGWVSLAESIYEAGFSVFNAHPVKAEMSGATPKSQAGEPIQIDVILVCRKQSDDSRDSLLPTEASPIAATAAKDKAARLVRTGFKLSRNDQRVILASELLRALGPIPDFSRRRAELETVMTALLSAALATPHSSMATPVTVSPQLDLWTA